MAACTVFQMGGSNSKSSVDCETNSPGNLRRVERRRTCVRFVGCVSVFKHNVVRNVLLTCGATRR